MTEHDPVNSPSHYIGEGGLESIDVIEAFLGTEGAYWFCRGNAIKYQLRADSKWNPAEDHRKTVWYANKSAELYGKLQEKKLRDLPEPPF